MNDFEYLKAVLNSASSRIKQDPYYQQLLFYVNTSKTYDEFLNKLSYSPSTAQIIGENLLRTAQELQQNKPAPTSLANELSRFGRDTLSGILTLVGSPLSGRTTIGETLSLLGKSLLQGVLPVEALYYAKQTPVIGEAVSSVPILDYSASLGEASAKEYPRLSKVMAGLQVASPLYRILRAIASTSKAASAIAKTLEKTGTISQQLMKLNKSQPVIKNVSDRILRLLKSGVTTGAEMLGWNWEQPFVGVLSPVIRSRFVQNTLRNWAEKPVIGKVIDAFLPAEDVTTANIMERIIQDKAEADVDKFINVAPEPQKGTRQYTTFQTAPKLFEITPFTRQLMIESQAPSLGELIDSLMKEGDYPTLKRVLIELDEAGFNLPLSRDTIRYYLQKELGDKNISDFERVIKKIKSKEKRNYIVSLHKLMVDEDLWEKERVLPDLISSEVNRMNIPKWHQLFDYTHKAHILDALGWSKIQLESEPTIGLLGQKRMGITKSRKIISEGVKDIELRVKHMLVDVVKSYTRNLVTKKFKKGIFQEVIKKKPLEMNYLTAHNRFRDITISNMLADLGTFMMNFLSAATTSLRFVLTHPTKAPQMLSEWWKGMRKEFTNLKDTLRRIWRGEPYIVGGVIRHAEDVVDIFSTKFAKRSTREQVAELILNEKALPYLSPTTQNLIKEWVRKGRDMSLVEFIYKNAEELGEGEGRKFLETVMSDLQQAGDRIPSVINLENMKTVSRFLHSFQNVVSTAVRIFDETLSDAIVKVATSDIIENPTSFRSLVNNLADTGEKLTHYFNSFILPSLTPPKLYTWIQMHYPRAIPLVAPFIRFGSTVLAYNVINLLYYLKHSPKFFLRMLPRLGAILSTWGIEGFILFNQGKAEAYWTLPYAYDKGIGVTIPLGGGRVLHISFSQIPIINSLIGWLSFFLPKPKREETKYLVGEILDWAGFRWLLGGATFEVMKAITGLTTERERFVSVPARLGRAAAQFVPAGLLGATAMINPFQNNLFRAMGKLLPVFTLMPRVTRKVWSVTPQTKQEKETGDVYVKTEQDFIDGIMTQSWLLTLLSSLFEIDEGRPLIDRVISMPRKNLRAPKNLMEWVGYMVNWNVFHKDVFRDYKLTADLRSDLLKWIKEAPTYEEWQQRLYLANHYHIKEVIKRFPPEIAIKAIKLRDRAMLPITPNEAIPRPKSPSLKKMMILRQVYFNEVEKMSKENGGA